MRKYRHVKTNALAVEFFNDWDAIFQVLDDPHRPLTNNAAERALRHWAIACRIGHGTRTDAGSRACRAHIGRWRFAVRDGARKLTWPAPSRKACRIRSSCG